MATSHFQYKNFKQAATHSQPGSQKPKLVLHSEDKATFINMEEDFSPPKPGETDSHLKKKVFRLERLFFFLAIFALGYPPIVVQYFLSQKSLVSQQVPMTSSDCKSIDCDDLKDPLELNDPAEDFEAQEDSPKAEQITEPSTENLQMRKTSANEETKIIAKTAGKSIQTSKTKEKSNQMNADYLPSSSRARESQLSLERNKDSYSFSERRSVYPPRKIWDKSNGSSRDLQSNPPNSTKTIQNHQFFPTHKVIKN